MPIIETLEQQLVAEGVSVQDQNVAYHPMLALVEIMLGYKPKVNGLCKLYDTVGFRTFHLLFKNSTGMPLSLLSKTAAGVPLMRELCLAMYVSSRQTGCEYCTAKTAAVALRRGALPEHIAALLETEDDDDIPQADTTCRPLSDRHKALYRMAQALSREPPNLTGHHIKAMRKHYSDTEIEWVARSVSLMGFLNLVTSSFGLGLERQAVQESAPVLNPTGWNPSSGQEQANEPNKQLLPKKDTLSTYLRMAQHGPQALQVEASWVAGVPSSWPKAGDYLKEVTGHGFDGLLGSLGSKRANRRSPTLRAYTAILRDHFTNTQIGLFGKALVGLVYATVVGNRVLQEEARSLATLYAKQECNLHLDATTAVLDRVVELVALQPTTPQTPQECAELVHKLSLVLPPPSSSKQQAAAALILARAASTRPTKIPPVIVTEIASLLTPAARVEVITWVGLQQCFVRILHFSQLQNQKTKEKNLQQQPEQDVEQRRSFVNKRRSFFNRRAPASKSLPVMNSAPAMVVRQHHETMSATA